MQDGLGRFSDYSDALRAIANADGVEWWQIVQIKDDELTIIDEGVRK